MSARRLEYKIDEELPILRRLSDVSIQQQPSIMHSMVNVREMKLRVHYITFVLDNMCQYFNKEMDLQNEDQIKCS